MRSSSAVAGHGVCLDYLLALPIDRGSIHYRCAADATGAARLQFVDGQCVVDDVSDQSECRGTTIVCKGGALVIAARDPGANDASTFPALITVSATPRYNLWIGD
jgi:hypothetical protein